VSGLQEAKQRMEDGGVPQRAIDVFSAFYDQLEQGATGMIHERDVDPLVDIDHASQIELSDEQCREAASVTAVIKLNGGLGTSMGLDRAKTLLPVRDEMTFLDVIAGQVLSLRDELGVRLPLLFMNSFRTRDDTLAALAAHDALPVDGLPLDFLQNREPKLRADDLSPVDWPADPSLEWCPPGHGDLYTALDVSGILDALLAEGYRYATVSNADNLGAAPDARMMGWFAASGAPYAAEVCRRTPADVKGGHIVVRKSDGRLVLRETAQTPDEDAAAAADPQRHLYFHTNNLWFDLQVVRRTRAAAHPQRQDRRPDRSHLAEGHPDRVGHGGGGRGVRRRDGDRGRQVAIPPGQDHQRPAAAALRRVRGRRRLQGAVAGRVGAAGRSRPALLHRDRRLRRPPAEPAVAGRGAVAEGRGRLAIRPRRDRAG
jgi:UTP--glucose-1-phosphate uridylyltransferase